MEIYTPALSAREAGRQIRHYVKTHRKVLWTIWKKYLPYVLIVPIMHGLLYATTGIELDMIVDIFLAYVSTMYVVSCHRVIIEGKDETAAPNVLKPTRNELIFFGASFALGVFYGAFFMAATILGLTTLGAIGGPLALITTGVVVAFVAYRSFLIFPARAVDRPVTLRDSWASVKGVFWKMLGAQFFASWRIFLAMIAYILVVGFLLFTFGFEVKNGQLVIDNLTLKLIIGYITTLPFYVVFQPLLLATMTGVLSNYYLWLTKKI